MVFQRIYGLIKDYRRFFVIGLIFVALIEIVNLAGGYIFKEIIDSLINFNLVSLNYLIYLILGSGAIYFIVGVLQYYGDLWIVKIQIKIRHRMTLLLYNKLLGLSLGYHERENTGAKLTKIQNGTDNIRQIIDRAMWNFFPVIMQVVFGFVLLVFVNWYLALSYIVIIPFFVTATLRMNYRVYPIQKRIRSGFERVYGGIGQAIYNVKTVQAFAQEKRERRQASRGVFSIISDQFKSVVITFKTNFLRFNLIGLGNMIMISLGVLFVYWQELTPGELVLFINIGNNSYFSLFSLTRVFDEIMEAKVGVERVIKVLNSQDEIIDDPQAEKLEVKGEIEFKNVSFDYGDGKVLNNINLKIKPGETVALVGPSGGGKTTIAKVIYRYYDVTAGHIYIDGLDLKKHDLANYRHQLGIVTQDVDIFNDSVAANIAYGRPDASLKNIQDAARIANAEEFILKLKKQYKTVVGEKGVKLSGGQKQRLGIARAILVDPKIMIFDEATSSLDASSEKLIQKAIQRVIKNRTTIIIAHRLSTIRHVDRILVIEDGRIVEQGTHLSLLAKNGKYARLIKLQTSGYLD